MLSTSLSVAPAEVIMTRLSALLLVTAALVSADSPRLPEDVYEIALLDGARVGFCHSSVRKNDGDDRDCCCVKSIGVPDGPR